MINCLDRKLRTAIILVTQKDAYPGEQLPADPSKPNVVVLGSGWGATSFLKNLDTEQFNVTVISPRNYFLFSPLLPSVTVGTIEARSIIQPTRYITRHKKRRVAVYEANAQEVDPVKKVVSCSGKPLPHGSRRAVKGTAVRLVGHQRRDGKGVNPLRLPYLRSWVRKSDFRDQGRG